MGTDVSIMILTDRQGRVVDAVRRGEEGDWLGDLTAEMIARKMRDGDTLVQVKRRLSVDENKTLMAERSAAQAKEAEAEADAAKEDAINKAAELRAAADKLEAGKLTFSQAVDQFSEEIPF